MGKNIRNIIINSIKNILIGILIILSILTITKDYQTTIKYKIVEEKERIGKITIPKINISNYLYKVDSEENTIEKNITILKESNFPNILFLAAHSGEGRIAYFENLDKLEKNDSVFLIMDHKKYTYQVEDIWEEKKNGYINVNKTVENQLVLTTCSPNKKNTQLIINCIEKDS